MSEDSAFSELLTRFSSITGIKGAKAKFYLESAAGDLQVALTSFYEDDNDLVDEQSIKRPDAPPPLESEPKTAKKVPITKFATIDSIRKTESGSDEEEGEVFYAGGSERSGQQVIAPGKKKKDIVSEMFKSAIDHGAEIVSSSGHSGSFKGVGYRLGASETDSTVSASISTDSRVQTPQPQEVILKLWKNGFSVGDGPLRDYNDSANQPFLTSIRNGEIPSELIDQVRGAEVTLNMEDHRSETFIACKVLKAFSGTGHKLGSPAPTPVFDAPVSSPSKTDSLVVHDVKVDSSLPTTNIQIRLADGTRLNACLNHTAAVEDLYRYITCARPEYESSVFVLMTTFPNRELRNRKASIKDENLLNAVVVQRLSKEK